MSRRDTGREEPRAILPMMPYLEGTQPPPVLVDLRPKLRIRFYEPLVLLLAATKACMHNLAPRIPEPVPDRFNMTQEQLFHDFINKLAQICDIQPGGSMVTAACALQYPDRVQYRFASNQRNEQELKRLKDFIVDILNTLQGWTEESSSPIKVTVLRKIVAFNRPRLQTYVKNVASQSSACLETSGLAPRVVEKLAELRTLSTAANDKELAEDTFFQSCLGLMVFIRRLSRSSMYSLFRDKANSAQAGEDCPWAELRHAAGRLLNYFEAAQTLVEGCSQAKWKPLFYDFEVVCIPSSRPISNPVGIRCKSASAANILVRMTPSHERANLAAYQHNAEQLQQFELDENIREQNMSNSFRPIVHAEVLVHESIVNDPEVSDVLHPSRFFEGYRYIGTSKPTCRLCHYYFRALRDNAIQVRQTHRNLYANWRAPDVFQDQGEIHGDTAAKRREDILNTVIKSVRKDTYRILSDKMSESKKHDSNTSRTYGRAFDLESNSRAEEAIEEENVDDIASTLGQLDLED